MASKSPGDKLAADLKKILSDYAEGITESVEDVIRKAAAKGRSTLKNTSPKSSGGPSFGKKHYADQWAVRQETVRMSTEAVIYNRAPTYRLAHLLEHGYVTRSGKRIQGKEHIKPVEEKIIREVTQGIRKAVSA